MRRTDRPEAERDVVGRTDPQPPAHDHGFSLVEILVSVVLLGMTVTAVMTTARVSIVASVTDRDHATSYTWLQAASDEIYLAPRVPCTSGVAAATASYDAAAKVVDRPPAWDSTSATIDVINVEFLGKATADADFEWSDAHCFEGTGYANSPLYTQRVTLQVTSPDGTIIETLEMVKSE